MKWLKEAFRKIKWDKSLFFRSFLWLGILLILIDQGTKWACQLSLDYDEPVTVIKNFFYITLSNNTGMAWSVGAGKAWGRALLIVISVVMSVAFYLYWRKNVEKETKPMNAALMLIFAGAFANLIDRAVYFFPKDSGYPYGVIDWIQFYLGGGPGANPTGLLKYLNPFPTFNIADAAIVVGIIFLIVLLIVRSIKEARASKDEPIVTGKFENTENSEEKPDGEEDR